jgi:hypothetical protein
MMMLLVTKVEESQNDGMLEQPTVSKAKQNTKDTSSNFEHKTRSSALPIIPLTERRAPLGSTNVKLIRTSVTEGAAAARGADDETNLCKSDDLRNDLGSRNIRSGSIGQEIEVNWVASI